MKKLLIIDPNDIFVESLTALLHRQYTIRSCADGVVALGLLHSFQPDCLIINLSMRGMDGITVLQQSSYVPPVVLAITSVLTPFVLQAAKDAGAGFILQPPCSAEAVARHLFNMIRISALPQKYPDPQDVTREHLRILGFPENRSGFLHLCVGIPLYAQDPQQSLTKELYPAIASICGNDNGDQVEIAIRRSVSNAWNSRKHAVWESYFPGIQKCPSNSMFISTLAEKLNLLRLQLLQAQNQ